MQVKFYQSDIVLKQHTDTRAAGYNLTEVNYKKTGKPRRPVDERFLSVVSAIMDTGHFQSDSDMARRAGWPANLRWRIREGAQRVNETHIDKLIAAYGSRKISKAYIMLGTGQMIEDYPPTITMHPDAVPTGWSGLSDVEPVTDVQKKIRVPVIPLNATASFIESVEGGWQLSHLDGLYTEWVEKVEGIRYNHLTVVFKVTGDSMSPDYKTGGKILSTFVDPSAWRYMRGTHVLSLKSGMLVLKKVIPTGEGTFTLHSSNTHYRDEAISQDEILAAWRVQYKTYEPAD